MPLPDPLDCPLNLPWLRRRKPLVWYHCPDLVGCESVLVTEMLSESGHPATDGTAQGAPCGPRVNLTVLQQCFADGEVFATDVTSVPGLWGRANGRLISTPSECSHSRKQNGEVYERS